MADKLILKPITPLSEEPGTVLFETDRLIVRRLAPSDAHAMASAGNDPLVAATLSTRFPHPYTLAASEAFLATACAPTGTAYPAHNAILLKHNSADNPAPEPLLVGALGVKFQGDVFYRTWELGYWLSSAQWRRGIMSEAVAGFVRWLFATWPALHRLEGQAYSTNMGSQNVLKKCGFVEESRSKEGIEKNGVIMDMVMFRLLRSEYEEQQKESVRAETQ